MPTAVRHTRPQPEYWNEITGFAHTQLSTDGAALNAFDFSATQQMSKYLSELDNDDLDRHLYYGLGLGMCAMLPGVSAPVSQLITTRKLHNNLLDQGLTFSRIFRQEPLSRITAQQLVYAAKVAMLAQTERAFRLLGPATRLTIQSMAGLTQQRRAVAQQSDSSDITVWNLRNRAVETDLAAEMVVSNAIGGVVQVLRRAVSAKQEVRPVYSTADLSLTTLYQPAARAAMLHSAECGDPTFLAAVFPADGRGDLTYVPGSLSKHPRLSRHTNEVLHQERLHCPAFNVGSLKLIRSMIDIIWSTATPPAPR